MKSIFDIPKDLFVKASDEDKCCIQVMRDPTTYWKDAWRRFRSNKLSLVAAIVIVIIILLAIFWPMFSPYQYAEQVKYSENIQPFTNILHPLGTDSFGRDFAVRLMIGARISILIGLVASVMVVLIGVLYGTISGYFGGWVDNVMMRIVDVIYAIPTLLIVILLSVVLKEPLEKMFETSTLFKGLDTVGPGLISIFITFALLYWVDMARIVRGQILSLKNQEYVNAAKALGAKPWRIMTKHLIPNCLGAIIVTATLNIPTAIFTEAFLSFIGLGVSAPMASLGSLASDALDGIFSYPYKLVLPAVLISLIILSFNLLGDGLRDALDPRMKNKG